MKMTGRQALDVSELPAFAFDARTPVWWGNTLLMVIESMTVALTIASYYYLSQNFLHWPPPNVNRNPPIYDTAPTLWIGTLNVALLLLSVAPTIVADRMARKFRFGPVVIALSITVIFAIACTVIRVFEFSALKVRWDENAYGSIVWWLLGLHFTHLITGLAEVSLTLFWVIVHGLDEKTGVDVTLTGAFWYWIAAIGVLVYAVLYWSPVIMSFLKT